MSSQINKFTLAAAAVLTLSYLAGCGTKGENTGFGDTKTGIAVGLGSGAGSSSSSTTGGLTGGATGTPVVNTAFPSTAATGLTISSMLPTTGGGGGGSSANNPPTRMQFGTFTSGKRPVVLQGFGLGSAQGRVTLLPRNPNATPGTNNVVLAPAAGTTNPATPVTTTNPFGMLVDGGTVFVADNATGAGLGRVVRYSNINETTGACAADQLAINLNSPVDIARDGNFLYVAEFGTAGSTGRISRIDISSTATFPNATTFVASVNFCTSIAIDNANGHHFLYLVENVAGSSGNANGGVSRIDLNTFVAGSGLLSGGAGSSPSTGVTLIQPAGGTADAYSNPFDIQTDNFSNVVFTDGLNAGTGLLNPNSNPGSIRLVTGGTTPAVTSQVVVRNSTSGSSTGLNALRGLNLFNEDSSGSVISAFFTEGSTGGTVTTARQLTFRASDAAIFRHIQLDSGKLSPLDTLFDSGDSTLSPVVPPNLKYCVGSFGGGTQGQVLDIR